MAQDYSEAEALKIAKQTVMRFEASSGGDINKVMGALVNMQSKNPISKIPTADEIFKQRVAELATAYARASDGNGGIDSANKQAAERFRNVIAGKMADGNGYALSQRLAIMTEKWDHVVEGIRGPVKKLADVTIEIAQETSHRAGKFGLPGKAIGAVAGVSVALATGNASASSLTEAGLNGVSNGLGTLVIGEGSGRNRLCQIFGDVVVPGAIGVGTSLVATPVAGLAAGTAASVALSEPATNSCNRFAQKLGF